MINKVVARVLTIVIWSFNVSKFVKFKKPTRKQLLERIVLLEEEIGRVRTEILKAVEQELNTRTLQLQDLLEEITALIVLLKNKGLVKQEEINEWLRKRKNG